MSFLCLKMFSRKMDKFAMFFVLVASVCVSQAFPFKDIVSYDEATQIADICRNRISGNFPHPNPERCDLFVRCSVIFET